MKSNPRIRPREARDDSRFIELRSKVFGDDADFLKFFADCFGDDYLDYVLTEEIADVEESIQGALTQFLIGKLKLPKANASENETCSHFDGMNVEISYAICTDKAARGKGYGSYITVYAREVAEASRRLSMLSPAEPSLIDFYEPLNYKKFMYAEHGTVDFSEADGAYSLAKNANASLSSLTESSEPNASKINALQGNAMPTGTSLTISRLTASEYNNHREAILTNRAHLALSKGALKFVSESSDGGAGLILISENSEQLAIAALDCEADEVLLISELLTFSESGGNYDLAMKLCSYLTKEYGKSKCDYMFPAAKGSKTALALGLLSISSEALSELYNPNKDEFVPYMGFTFG